MIFSIKWEKFNLKRGKKTQKNPTKNHKKTHNKRIKKKSTRTIKEEGGNLKDDSLFSCPEQSGEDPFEQMVRPVQRGREASADCGYI